VVEVVVGAVKSGGRYARAELVIKAGGRQAKFSVEMSYTVKIQFNSSNREAAEEAAAVLREAGVEAELKNYWDKSVNREKWYIKASIDKLAAARKELREAIAQVVRQAEEAGLLSREKAQSWLQKLLRMRFSALLDSRGALRVMYKSTSPLAVEYAAERLQRLGLRPGVHYRAKKPQGGGRGWVTITPEGLRHLAYLAAQAQDEQIRAETTQLLQQVKEAAEGEARRRLEEEIEAGRSRGAAKLTGLKIGDVAIHEAKAWIEKEQLRIWIRAEVGGAPLQKTITFTRGARGEVRGYTYAHADAPGGRAADAHRTKTLIIALTGHEPTVVERRDGAIMLKLTRRHLEALMKYAEIHQEAERWLQKTKKEPSHLLNTSNPTSRRGSATAVSRRRASGRRKPSWGSSPDPAASRPLRLPRWDPRRV
jgi:hypothetical protein